jgi:hypothetical protein
MSTQGRKPATEIEITPAMIDAGVRELLSWLDGVVPEMTPFSTGKIVSAVYATMADHART